MLLPAVCDEAFPVLIADLELAELLDGQSRISLSGSYRPPLSVAGGLADRAIGHLVAEASVRRFVLDIADRLTTADEVAPEGSGPAVLR